jgi:predicted DNA-binding protein
VPVTNASRRQRGLRLVQLWLPQETVTRLDAICCRSGHTRPEVIRGYIDSETEDWNALDKRKVSRRPRST